VSEYQDYKAYFDQNRALLEVPEDCTVCTPQYNATDLVNPKSWDFRWFLRFRDNHYICCAESLSRRQSPRRHYFSFHYGPIVQIDASGKIVRDQNNPLIIRACKSRSAICHLHYRHPHPFPDYKQDQIDGLVLENVDIFRFVRAVFRSRADNVEMHVAMGFTDPATRP